MTGDTSMHNPTMAGVDGRANLLAAVQTAASLLDHLGYRTPYPTR